MKLFSLLTLISLQFLMAADTSKPNVIIILTDDQGYNDLSCYGSKTIKSPRIDQLAEEGLKLTSYYVASPVCSASRAALLTGRYPKLVGVPGVFFPNRGHKGLDPKHQTIAKLLKSVGYATKAVGKWHLGDELEFLPTNQGFDSYYGIPYSNDMTPAFSMKYSENCLYREGVDQEALKKAFEANKIKPVGMKDKVPLMRNDECIEMPADQSTITKRFTDESIKFIDESTASNKPFFLYLAHSMPHTPLYVSKDFEGKSAGGIYGDVIEEIDYNVGRIIDHLNEKNIAENTLFIYTSDNGPWLIKKSHGGSALPLFEGKMTSFEGGQRVPAIIRWPAKIPKDSVSNEMTLSMDIFPTLAKITGAKAQDADLINGKNALELYEDPANFKTKHDYFFYSPRAVRHKNWKYHQQETFKLKSTARKTKGPSLYDLSKDIGESKNLINDYPEIAAQLKNALLEHNKKKQ
ncbi:arylsulfatase A [Lentisphaera araneosa HTCC2155]|uniref:Arylsulfatase A n=1 Tax=Lentisphaera araneosa HTCC2155 TaxID=313628 RepID=A6DJ11_9BACT|nr:sulfatase-like hydrolase/transferase [Lentisphaera araneosa]EDM28447.1 arylsulfatase A [Lentisphaera araneosa HTCC2155]